MKWQHIERAIPLGGSLVILIGLGFALSQSATSQQLVHAKPMPILFLPYNGSVAAGQPAFQVTNTGYADGIMGVGGSNGVHGQSASASNGGVWGENVGGGYGVIGSTNGNTAGVCGTNFGSGIGVLGNTNNGIGVEGATSQGYGVYGVGLYGVDGVGSTCGVLGTGTDQGIGVQGYSTNAYGVWGYSNHKIAVYGSNGDSGNYGELGTGSEGVYGNSANGYGVHGESAHQVGVIGSNKDTNNYGELGTGYEGVYGYSNNSYGIVGGSIQSYGVYGGSTNSSGLYGYSSNGNGVEGHGSTGVYGAAPSDGVGVWGQSVNGDAVFGRSSNRGHYGLLGGQAYSSSLTYHTGVYGNGDLSGAYDGTLGVGVMGQGDFAGVYGITNGSYAGYFDGTTFVAGVFNAGAKLFKIDHPLDPANKYLNHSCIESSEYMNLYRGNVTLDANGQAIVTVPDWFEALNKNYSYQLTCVGGFAPVYIAQELQHRQFAIAGGKPGMKVCWQIMGERQDPFVKAHPLEVEQVKPEGERGLYLHPREYGLPESRGIHVAQNPERQPQVEGPQTSGLPLPSHKH